MPSLSTLLLFSAVTALLVATPGPGVLYVVSRSVDQGRRAGLISMFAIESAEVVYIVAAAAGLTALLAASATALDALRFLGAGYLILLGIRRWRRPDDAGSGLDRSAPSSRRVFAQGFVVQLLNPKVAVFFLAYFPQFLDPHAPIAPQVLVLGSVYVAVACACDAVWVLVSSELAQRLARSSRAQRAIGRASALTYIVLGIAAALTGERAAAARAG